MFNVASIEKKIASFDKKVEIVNILLDELIEYLDEGDYHRFEYFHTEPLTVWQLGEKVSDKLKIIQKRLNKKEI